MLEEVLRHLRNWFVLIDGIHFGRYSIEGCNMVLPFLKKGQYFRIVGSVFNDGLHQYPADELTAETFDGAVWALAIPKALVEISAEIEVWQEKNGNADSFASESFAGYTYTKTANEHGGAMTWQDAFRGRLHPWRKL